jgi:hypothetical protein
VGAFRWRSCGRGIHDDGFWQAVENVDEEAS